MMEMMQTRWCKKPVVVEAVQFTGDGFTDILGEAPEWLITAMEKPSHCQGAICAYDNRNLKITTLEGKLIARPGDWIIRGVQGEIYPCKPDIFHATYEPVDNPEAATTIEALAAERDAEIAEEALKMAAKEIHVSREDVRMIAKALKEDIDCRGRGEFEAREIITRLIGKHVAERDALLRECIVYVNEGPASLDTPEERISLKCRIRQALGGRDD